MAELTFPNPHATLDSFQLLRADRSTKGSGKRGIVMFVRNRWCNLRHISEKEHFCRRDIELLAVSIQPMLQQPVSSYTLWFHNCRHCTPRPSSSSSETSIMLPYLPLSPPSPSTLNATPDNRTLGLLYANMEDAYILLHLLYTYSAGHSALFFPLDPVHIGL